MTFFKPSLIEERETDEEAEDYKEVIPFDNVPLLRRIDAPMEYVVHRVHLLAIFSTMLEEDLSPAEREAKARVEEDFKKKSRTCGMQCFSMDYVAFTRGQRLFIVLFAYASVIFVRHFEEKLPFFETWSNLAVSLVTVVIVLPILRLTKLFISNCIKSSIAVDLINNFLLLLLVAIGAYFGQITWDDVIIGSYNYAVLVAAEAATVMVEYVIARTKIPFLRRCLLTCLP